MNPPQAGPPNGAPPPGQPPQGGPPPPGAQPPGPPGQPGQPQPPGAPPGAPQRPPLKMPPMPLKKIPKHSTTSTHQPEQAGIKFVPGPKRGIDDQQWTALSLDLYQSIVPADYGARGALNANLQDWHDAYDMIAYQKNKPFVNSSNLQLPYATAQVDSLVAYVGGTVLQPRLILVTGNTPEAAKFAPQMEKYYNAEAVRLRADGSSYIQELIRGLRMAMRDGTAAYEVMWARERRRRTVVTNEPQMNEDGSDWLYGPDGQVVWKEHRQDVDDFVRDYPQITPIPYKEFGLIPAEAPSIEAAVGLWRTEWLYEDELNARINAGFFDRDEVERALTYVPQGTSDVASDPSGTYDKQASYQIGVGLAQGSLSSEFFSNRGPLKLRRIHSRQYDMNQDGRTEECIFWLHEQSQRMLGWMYYEYPGPQRPLFKCTPFPRPDEFSGFSVMERLAGVQTELDTMNNERRDAISQRILAPLMVEKGSELLNRKGEYGIDKLIEVDRVGGPQGASFAQLQLPDVPLASFQDESLTKSYGDEWTGLSQPALGGQSSGRRSATEMRQRNSAQGTRLDLICKEFRTSLIQIFNFIHSLNKQYLQTSPTITYGTEQITVPAEAFALDYTITVVGASDPIDSITRRQENTTFVQMIAQMFPWVMQDPVKSWRLGQILFDSYGRSDASAILGTEEEAQQRAAQQQQAQQKQQQLMEEQHKIQLAEAQARIQHGTPQGQANTPKAGGKPPG